MVAVGVAGESDSAVRLCRCRCWCWAGAGAGAGAVPAVPVLVAGLRCWLGGANGHAALGALSLPVHPALVPRLFGRKELRDRELVSQLHDAIADWRRTPPAQPRWLPARAATLEVVRCVRVATGNGSGAAKSIAPGLGRARIFCSSSTISGASGANCLASLMASRASSSWPAIDQAASAFDAGRQAPGAHTSFECRPAGVVRRLRTRLIRLFVSSRQRSCKIRRGGSARAQGEVDGYDGLSRRSRTGARCPC